MNRLSAIVFALLIAPPVFACDIVKLGDIEVDHAWARASLGAGRPGVVYLTIRNTGPLDDVLTALTTPVADMPMLHETVITDGVAAMPHVMSVPVPAGETVALAPGGLHGMLMGLTAALDEGGTFPLTLSFQNAGQMVVTVEVLGMGASGPDCGHAQP